MVTIRCSVYEKHDLLQTIEYAKKKKIEDCNNKVITPYLLKIELNQLDKLKQRINGQVVEDYSQSSFEFNKNYPTERRKKDELPKKHTDSRGKWS